MHLNDCEVFAREVRGQRLSIIVGPRAVTPAEGSALLDQFFGTHTGPAPVFASPEGWQILEPAPAVAPVVEVPQEETPKPKARSR